MRASPSLHPIPCARCPAYDEPPFAEDSDDLAALKRSLAKATEGTYKHYALTIAIANQANSAGACAFRC
jgi:hypothetical protein